MTLLVDGLNLIYKFPELEAMMYYSQLDNAREGLLEILKSYQKLRKGAINVFFDGRKGPSNETKSEKSGTINVFYSLDYSADFLIKQFVKKDTNPKMLTVVTSDKDIIFYINRFGAKNITSEKFAEHVDTVFNAFHKDQELVRVSREKENPVISDDELSYWQKIFSRKKIRGTVTDMSNPDYKQIFYAAASALDASANVIIEAQDLNRYSADITMENGSVITFTAIPGEYSFELSLAKESLEHRKYTKFMSRFEYNLEQKFYKNIKLDSQETPKEYKIKISF